MRRQCKHSKEQPSLAQHEDTLRQWLFQLEPLGRPRRS